VSANPSLAEMLTDTCVGLSSHPLPRRAVTQATRAVLDVLGCALAGSAEPAVDFVARLNEGAEAAPPSVLIGRGTRSSPVQAALVNGTAAHVLDFDDIGCAPGAGHPGVAAVPAALALAEAEGATGLEFLTAVAAGYEVATRLATAVGAGPFGRGFHGTSVYGVFSATAACACVLRLDRQQLLTAFGIAASRSAGVRANVGTMTKALQVGEANRSGVTAALLAREGFTANPDALDGPHGWLAAYADGQLARVPSVGGAGGRPLAIEAGIMAKLYPSCAATHGVLHALQAILGERGSGTAVTAVRIEIPEAVLRRSLLPDWPEDGLQARFSLAFCVAVMVAHGGVGPADFTVARIAEVAPVAERITVIALAADRKPTTIQVEFDDGIRVNRGCLAAVDIPVSPQQLRDKFIMNLKAVGRSSRSVALLAAIDDLPSAPGLATVSSLLA
jgi:2-methylcitrate dehydratase PrpD